MNKLLEKVFFSRLFQNIRLRYYHEVYQQGKFDKEMESTVENNAKGFMRNSGLEEMFDMTAQLDIKREPTK
jgi:hypothetical protein